MVTLQSTKTHVSLTCQEKEYVRTSEMVSDGGWPSVVLM